MKDTEMVPRRRSRFRLYGLLTLNGALLVVLAMVTFSPTSEAQNRLRGEYAMVAGRIQSASADAIYVVDTANQELIALGYEPNQKELLGIGYRNLAADAASMQRRGSSR